MSLVNDTDAGSSTQIMPNKCIRLYHIVMSMTTNQSTGRFIKQVSAQHIMTRLHRNNLIFSTTSEKDIILDNRTRFQLGRPGMSDTNNFCPVATVRLTFTKEIMIYQMIIQVIISTQPHL